MLVWERRLNPNLTASSIRILKPKIKPQNSFIEFRRNRVFGFFAGSKSDRPEEGWFHTSGARARIAGERAHKLRNYTIFLMRFGSIINIIPQYCTMIQLPGRIEKSGPPLDQSASAIQALGRSSPIRTGFSKPQII